MKGTKRDNRDITEINKEQKHSLRSPARPPKGGPPLAGKDPKQVITLKDKSTSNDGCATLLMAPTGVGAPTISF